MNRLVTVAGLSLLLSSCVAGAGDEDDLGADEAALKTEPGVNGSVCSLSEYNCKLRAHGGNRVAHVNGDLDWAVDTNVEVLDGNGDVLGVNKTSTLKFNYGQERTFGGKTYAFAMSTSNKSSGWFPLSAVHSASALSARMGHVTAHRSGLKRMACYAIRNDSDPTLAEKKVVYDSSSSPGPSGEAAGDYLSKLRANGKRSANLDYNLPGSGLGGPAIDHFPAGTKFQRLEVPTDNNGPPSLDVKLWLQDSHGRFKKPAGTMKFIYGYVVSKTGDVRTGWMAADALEVSSGCP
jgi:hypothetical protein